MNELLAIATEKGSFDHLTAKKNQALEKYTGIVKACEDSNYTIPLSQTVQGLIALKMYKKNL
jgi:hypothetical protein